MTPPSVADHAAPCPGQILVSDRTCLVCHWPILPGVGVGHPHLRALSHQGLCAAAIADLERIRDRSRRGRWRPARQVRTLAAGSRCVACRGAAR
jgi:hypothetical protein